MKIALSTEIRCSPKALWPWLTEPERMKQWMKGLVSVEPSDPAQLKVGAPARFTIREGRRDVTYDEQVLAVEPNRRLTISFSTPQWRDLVMHVDYQLHDLGNATRLDYSCEARTDRLVFKLMGLLFGVFAKLQAKSFMKSLKRLAEA